MAESVVGKLKNFGKGLIFETDENAATENQAQTPADQAVPQKTFGPVAENDSAYVALYSAVMERDTPYARFLKTIKSLESVPMDATARYIAAREVLKGNGVSPDQVLHSINVHVGILDAKKAEFAETVKSQEHSGVTALEDEFGDAEKAVEKNREQIARLQAEISEQEKRKASLQNEIASQRAKIKSVVEGFQSAAAALAQKLETDRTKISGIGL